MGAEVMHKGNTKHRPWSLWKILARILRRKPTTCEPTGGEAWWHEMLCPEALAGLEALDNTKRKDEQ